MRKLIVGTTFSKQSGKLGGLDAVSYTHLDVYKRQVSVRPIKIRSVRFLPNDGDDVLRSLRSWCRRC